MKKAPLKLPAKTFDGAKRPFCAGMNKKRTREAEQKGLHGCNLLFGVSVKSFGQAFLKACGFQRQSLWKENVTLLLHVGRAGKPFCAAVSFWFAAIAAKEKEQEKDYCQLYGCFSGKPF